MMTDVILQLTFGASCIAVGFFVGLSISWREYRIGTKSVPAPALPRTDRQQAHWLIVVAVLAVASTAFAAMQSSRQAECNSEFRSTLVTRSAIVTENQRHLDDMISVIADASANPKPDSREQVRQAIIAYQGWVDEAQKKRAANPLTDPECGG